MILAIIIGIVIVALIVAIEAVLFWIVSLIFDNKQWRDLD